MGNQMVTTRTPKTALDSMNVFTASHITCHVLLAYSTMRIRVDVIIRLMYHALNHQMISLQILHGKQNPYILLYDSYYLT